MNEASRGHYEIGRWVVLVLTVLVAGGCSMDESGQLALTAEVPLHLEEHLDTATIEGSEVADGFLEPIEWRFDEPQPDWQAPVHRNPAIPALQMEQIDDVLRVTLSEENINPRGGGGLHGDVYVPLPDLDHADWGRLILRTRASAGIRRRIVGLNLGAVDTDQGLFSFYTARPPRPISDGSVHTYEIPIDRLGSQWGPWEGPWRELGLAVFASEPATLDVLSVRIVPKEAAYTDAPAATRTVSLGNVDRQTLYSHTPGRIGYRVVVPPAGRLDVGLGVVRHGMPVTFRVSAEPEGGVPETLLQETYADNRRWAQRSADLSHLAGQTVTLTLEAAAERAGAVALWGAPTLSGARTSDKPNVVFFVIDGAASELMSLYGYNRRTTPNLERLAAEGAVFEHVYSNASWTRPSTASFMTSLQHSVLGGFKNGFNVVPDNAPTMAQHMHRAGYETAVFTANANAGRMSGLEREVDRFQESWEEFAYGSGVGLYAESSRIAQEAFWRWRDTYPGAPYWVHFQTTDTHEPWIPVAPFAGLFVNPELRKTYQEWDRQRRAAGPPNSTRFERAGVDREAFYQVRRSLYDEGMAHTDYQIGQLVRRLKAAGEWDNTLFIVASDHGHRAAGVGWSGPSEHPWDPSPIFSPWVNRIPLIVVWPGRIGAGQRLGQPASMIDVLPTILELTGLPMPEVMQGQSLAPLLLGEEGWEPRPVILDEFTFDADTEEPRGLIEVIDGRWGASLEINPDPEREPDRRRPAPLLLYDLWNDPGCVHSLHEERPDLVEKYTAFLQEQFAAHRSLAQLFTPAAEVPLTLQQLESLRALGYIQ